MGIVEDLFPGFNGWEGAEYQYSRVFVVDWLDVVFFVHEDIIDLCAGCRQREVDPC